MSHSLNFARQLADQVASALRPHCTRLLVAGSIYQLKVADLLGLASDRGDAGPALEASHEQVDFSRALVTHALKVGMKFEDGRLWRGGKALALVEEAEALRRAA